MAHRTVVAAVGLALAAAFAPAAVADAISPEVTVVRVISDPSIVESSGLARSTYARPLLWTHNDSGDGPRVFAVNKEGDTRAVLTLGCAAARDWEDISSGPGHTLWVGDIGQNIGARKTIQVYRFVEPRRVVTRKVRCTRFALGYPDGTHDAEALLVKPGSGRVWVVSKASSGAAIYRAPKHLVTGQVNKLRRISSAPPMVTAGTWRRDGERFALSTYDRAYIYHRDKSLAASFPIVWNGSTVRGEALEYSRSGRALFRTKEGSHGNVWRIVW